MGVVIFPERPIMIYSHPENSKGYIKGTPGSKGHPFITTLRGATVTGCAIPPYSRASTRQSSRSTKEDKNDPSSSGGLPFLELPAATGRSSTVKGSTRRPQTRQELKTEREQLRQENASLREQVRTAKGSQKRSSKRGLRSGSRPSTTAQSMSSEGLGRAGLTKELRHPLGGTKSKLGESQLVAEKKGLRNWVHHCITEEDDEARGDYMHGERDELAPGKFQPAETDQMTQDQLRLYSRQLQADAATVPRWL